MTAPKAETKVMSGPPPGTMTRAESAQVPAPAQAPSTGLDAPRGPSIAEILYFAVEKGIAPESLEKLVAVQERMEDRNARKEFARALAKFKAECPVIAKSKHVDIPSTRGSYGFDYAPLEEALPTMQPHLEANGFTVKWDRTVDGKGMLTSVCTLRHVGGHSDTSSFTLPTESSNPGMSIQHKYSGAATFADRKSLFAVLGIVAEKEGAAAAREVDPTLVNDDQLADLQDKITERLVGKTPEKADAWKSEFLKHFGIERLPQLRAANYQEALAAIQYRRKGGSSS